MILDRESKEEVGVIGILIVIAVLLGAINFYINIQLNSDNLVYSYIRSKNIFSFFGQEEPKRIIYGFLPYWSLNEAKYIQLDKLTDIAYFGLYLNPDGTYTKIGEDGNQSPGYLTWRQDEELSKLIERAKSQGVRVSLTTIAHDADDIDEFLRCRSCWDTYIEETVDELNFHQLRDVHLNFEYVGDMPEDSPELYSEFVKFVNEELDKKYNGSFVVVSTFAISAKPDSNTLTKIDDMALYADALFIMAYDFKTPNSDVAGAVSPMEGIGEFAIYDLKTMVKDYMAIAPVNKLIMGVPYYGNNWIVAADEPNARRVPGTDETGSSQSQNFSNIMELIIEKDPDIKWDEIAKVPYFTYADEERNTLRQVYYDDKKSLSYKYDLINTWDFAGVGIWALGYDGGYVDLWGLLEEKFLR